ncbi:MAG: rhodanese-like domain-containing protein, partial [Psychrobium sp.]
RSTQSNALHSTTYRAREFNVKKLTLLLATLMLSVFTTTIVAQQTSREKIAWQDIKQGVLVVDVRTAKEFDTGHIKNALNIPYDIAVNQFTALGIDKDRRIVLYCRSGNRSGKAITALTEAGYTNLHNGGGYDGLMKNK